MISASNARRGRVGWSVKVVDEHMYARRMMLAGVPVRRPLRPRARRPAPRRRLRPHCRPPRGAQERQAKLPRAHDRRPRGHPQRACRLPAAADRAAGRATSGARVAGAAGDLGLVEGRALVLRVIGIGQARPCLPEAPTRLLGGNGPGATSSIDRGLPTERLLAPHRHQASRSGSLGPTNRRGRPSRASAQSRSWRQRPARSGCRVQRRL